MSKQRNFKRAGICLDSQISDVDVLGTEAIVSASIICGKYINEYRQLNRELDDEINFIRAQLGLDGKLPIDEIDPDKLPVYAYKQMLKYVKRKDELETRYGSYNYFWGMLVSSDYRWRVDKLELQMNNMNFSLKELDSLIQKAWEAIGY